jgi:hypothetical protein
MRSHPIKFVLLAVTVSMVLPAGAIPATPAAAKVIKNQLMPAWNTIYHV